MRLAVDQHNPFPHVALPFAGWRCKPSPVNEDPALVTSHQRALLCEYVYYIRTQHINRLVLQFHIYIYIYLFPFLRLFNRFLGHSPNNKFPKHCLTVHSRVILLFVLYHSIVNCITVYNTIYYQKRNNWFQNKVCFLWRGGIIFECNLWL